MRVSTLLIEMGLICCLALPAIAQESTPSESVQPKNGAEVLGTVVHGNTTIIFEAAGTHGINSSELKKWDRFAEEHPKIAAVLAYKPSIIDDSNFVNEHPELATFFQAHPDIRDAMKENPGNFVAIPPRPGE
jgi:hypothetical protein